jgi:hypothetical protein
MRILTLVLSFLVTAILATLTYTYVSSRVGQRRVVVQAGWLGSSEPQAYRAYGETGRAELAEPAGTAGDTVTAAAVR